MREYARQAHALGTARVFVVTPVADPSTVAGYYAWAMAGVAPAGVSDRARRGAGRYPQPVALLARLGVDVAHERRGLGAAMLADVVARTLDLAERIGCRGLLIHAEDEAARSFYLRVLPGLEPSPTDPLHLVLLTADIRHTLDAPSLEGGMGDGGASA